MRFSKEKPRGLAFRLTSLSQNPLIDDLEHILEYTTPLFENLRGARIFITGGTGFFGRWFLESLIHANSTLDLNCTALVLTRNAKLFKQSAPHLAEHEKIELLIGDVRSFDLPPGRFKYVIHAATESSTALNQEDPALMLETIEQGMKRVLNFAARCHCSDLLFTSSGAVYGSQPATLTHLTEDFPGGPNPLNADSAYAEGKRLAELLGAIALRNTDLSLKIARCFAFVGPYLPLTAHFAIGNFIGDALKGSSIKIQGDGTAHRSYLYASDLMIWLWTILFQGKSLRPYNVGSEESHSILEIAQAVSSQISPKPPITVANQAVAGEPPSRYVPCTARARQELGLVTRIGLAAAIAKTIAWHRAVNTFGADKQS